MPFVKKREDEASGMRNEKKIVGEGRENAM